jgi:hypothetical protein
MLIGLFPEVAVRLRLVVKVAAAFGRLDDVLDQLTVRHGGMFHHTVTLSH